MRRVGGKPYPVAFISAVSPRRNIDDGPWPLRVNVFENFGVSWERGRNLGMW
jgi:hypothetical protein